MHVTGKMTVTVCCNGSTATTVTRKRLPKKQGLHARNLHIPRNDIS